MALDVSGALLEGIRAGRGDNPFTMPPRTLVTDDAALQAVTVRVEYALLAWSASPAKTALEIADPDLRFRWVRNRGSVSRFGYDSFSQRWTPLPGAAPDRLGPLANDPRVTAPVPDLAQTDAPFALYVGSPVRQATFSVQQVATAFAFSAPSSLPAGTVQLSAADGQLNFSSADVALYAGQAVLCQRQSFFDRTRSTGSIGALPASHGIDYFLFLNPRPAPGQTPLVRVGYGRHLTPVEVATEASLGAPAAGTFTWSADTGRIRFSAADAAAGAGLAAYYDGVVQGSLQLQRTVVGTLGGAFPSAAFTLPALVGLTDSKRFVFFTEIAGQDRRYLRVSLHEGVPERAPKAGVLAVDTLTGQAYVSASDLLKLLGWTVSYVDSVVDLESGVSVQFFRSAVNGSGKARVPDFRVEYEISDQVVASGLGAAPFVLVPTVPVVDASLQFRIARGPGSTGSYVGPLSDGSLPSSTGLGYLLDLDAKQLSFSSRRSFSTTVRVPTSSVKLPDGVISERGMTATRNGSAISPGTDFDFDPATGLIEFLDLVGESDPSTVEGVAGQAVLPDVFRADSRIFTAADVGSWLLIQSGPAVGAYQVRALSESSPLEAFVSGPFPAAGVATASIRREAEVVADRFWRPLRPPYKKFSLVRQKAGGQPEVVGNDKFEVFINVGQVNVSEPAEPGETFTSTYVSLESSDGVTFTPVNRVEKALFKVRREAATYAPGSREAFFNAAGNTVGLARPMTVYVNGVILEPDQFSFVSPNVLRFPNSLQAETIFVDYWVEEAPGGNTSFGLLSPNVDLDFPKLVEGEPTCSFNGDQTAFLTAGSALLVGASDVLLVASSTYSASADATAVTFTTASPVTTGPDTDLSTSGPLSMLNEASSASVLSEGTSTLSLFGDRSSACRAGTIVQVGADPYLCTGSRFDASTGWTSVSLAAPALRNYVLPQVRRSRTPVQLPTADFQTARPLHGPSPSTFVRMGATNRILERDVDYLVSDGGTIKLATPVGFGETLVLFYVAKSLQPAGTQFSFGYSHAVAPSQSNGLAGQRLLASYRLVAPDSFFYRVETFSSFLPEVSDSLRQDAQAGGASGPNTADASSQSNKDFGVPGPWFDEQHESNLDFASIRMLKFFNDLVNHYEDVLCGMDGRVVGGRSGRFRFDGLTSNPRRATYSAVTNDIDDQVKVYDGLRLESFFTFSFGPVYALMADPSRLSRLFPTKVVKPVALNDLTAVTDFGQEMGSLEVSNVKAVDIMRSTRASALFTGGPGTSLTIEANGDPDLLIPPFAAGQDVRVHGLDGSPEVFTQVSSVTGSGPFTVTLASATGLSEGSLLQDVSDPANTANHSYLPGKDLAVDPDSGQVVNITFDPGGFQEQVAGNELVDAPVTFAQSDTAPRRIPVLDGSELDDDGRVPAPRLRARSESAALEDEIAALGRLGLGMVGPVASQVASSVQLQVGQSVRFLDGPNAGVSASVTAALGPGVYSVSPAYPALDATGSSFLVDGVQPALEDVLAEEVGLLSSNVAASPVAPALVGRVRAELPAIEAAVRLSCATLASGTGTASGTILTDLSASFLTAGAAAGALILVPSGANRGLYLVVSATATALTVDPASPFAAFPAPGSTPYELLLPEAFLESDQFGTLSEVYRAAVAFLSQTLAWQAAPSEPGKVARIAQLNSRLAQIPVLADALAGVLDGLGLYDQRYLWISQRTDRKEGSLTKKRRAESARQEELAKMAQAQLKLLVAESL